jgi:3-vinyl bacteriochlorophyllide hydratase
MTVVQTQSTHHPTADGAGGASPNHSSAANAEAVAHGRSPQQRTPQRAATRAVDPRVLLYTPEQKRRRDETKWTLVQGILAPLQLLAMFVSVALVLRYLRTGEGLLAANVSVVVKTGFLYVIMITGAIWEKVVFGQYLFHEKFFWEDVVSMFVIGLHTAYLYGLFNDWNPDTNLLIALAGYAAYTVNAAQFLLKLRAARLADAAMRADQALETAGAGA